MSTAILSVLKKEFGSVFGNVVIAPTLSTSALIAFHSKRASGVKGSHHRASCEANTTPYSTKFVHP